MTGKELKLHRQQKGWTQKKAVAKLGVSQPYLSLLEKGERPVPERLAHKAANVYGVSPSALPLNPDISRFYNASETTLARDLATLGYPGFSYLKPQQRKNPAETVLSTLTTKNPNSRLTEALPWVLFKYPDLNWEWLVAAARANLVQNKLGFLTNLARRLAERNGEPRTASLLREKELSLQQSLLVREDPLSNTSLKSAEHEWLKANRPVEAKTWRVLTDLVPEHLSYVS
jgi:transcriptional regulator with XRE-family HTH domain